MKIYPTTKSNHRSLFSTVKKHPFQAIKETKIIEEFEVYIKEPVLPDGDAFSLLLYWKTNAHHFQCLSVIARDILCVPPSTANIESCFSTAALILSAKRNRLNAEKFEELVLIQQNRKFLKKQ